MEEKQWDKLDKDCLVEIFHLVALESLVFTVPKVCKSWHDASRDSSCWRNIKFPELRVGSARNTLMFDFIYKYGRPKLGALIKFVVDSSQKSIVSLQLPSYCDGDTYEYVSRECPNLTSLDLPCALVRGHGDLVAKSMKNLKNLEEITIRNGHALYEILEEVQVFCPKFATLRCSSFKFGEEEAKTLVAMNPKLKRLCIEWCWLRKEILAMIRESCKGAPLNILGLGAGGGCGVGLGLGWGFGSAFGSQYRSSRVTFQGTDFTSDGETDSGQQQKDVKAAQ